MAKNKRKLGVANAVNKLKDNVVNIEVHNDGPRMKVTLLDINTLVEYKDNESVFGNLEGSEFEDLCQSINERGILQPVIVRSMDEQYEILAGHQRTRGAKAVGELKVPAIIKNVDDVEARKIWLETNIRSRHLSKSQLAEALQEYSKLVEEDRKKGLVQGKTSAVLAEKFDISTRSVEELLMFHKKIIKEIMDLGLAKTSMKALTDLSKEEQDVILQLLGEDTIKSLTTAEIKLKVDTLKNEYDSELTILKQDLEDKKTEVKDKDKLINELDIKSKQATDKHDAVLKTMSNLQIEMDNIQEKLKEASNTDKEALKEQLQKIEIEYKSKVSESEKLSDKIKSLDIKYNETLIQSQTLKDELKQEQINYKGALKDNESLKGELLITKTKKKELEEELEELRNKDTGSMLIRDIEGYLNNINHMISSDILKDDRYKDSIKSIKKELKAITNRIKV